MLPELITFLAHMVEGLTEGPSEGGNGQDEYHSAASR